MPQVKPTVTACGMWRISEPSRESAEQDQHQPRHQTVSSKPVQAEPAAVAATSTMKAPAGPPI